MAVDIRQYVIQESNRLGIDPNVALKVIDGEGGFRDPYQRGLGRAPKSQAPGLGATENSYGPLQLYISGTGAGLGDRALAAGIDPRKDWRRGVTFGLEEARKHGWGQWYGAKARGITGMMGINGAAPGPDGPKGQEAYLPPLPTRTITDHPIADVAPDAAPIVATAAPDDSILDKLKSLNVGADGKDSPLDKLGGALKAPEAPQPTPIIQTGALASSDTLDATRMAQAQQMMASLMASKRKKIPGLTLGPSFG